MALTSVAVACCATARCASVAHCVWLWMSTRDELLIRYRATAAKRLRANPPRKSKGCGSCGDKKAKVDYTRPAECYGISDERDGGDQIIFCLHALDWVDWSLCELCVNQGGLRHGQVSATRTKRHLCKHLTARTALKMYYHGDESDPIDAWDITCSGHAGEPFPEFRCWGCKGFAKGEGAHASTHNQRAQRGAGPTLDD